MSRAPLPRETQEAIRLYDATRVFLATHPGLPEKAAASLEEQAARLREDFTLEQLLQWVEEQQDQR